MALSPLLFSLCTVMLYRIQAQYGIALDEGGISLCQRSQYTSCWRQCEHDRAERQRQLTHCGPNGACYTHLIAIDDNCESRCAQQLREQTPSAIRVLETDDDPKCQKPGYETGLKCLESVAQFNRIFDSDVKIHPADCYKRFDASIPFECP